MNLDNLKRNPLFQSIKEDQLVEVIDCLSGYFKKYQAGELIFGIGEKNYSLGIIQKGKIEISKDDFLGNRFLLTVLEEGELFAETFVCAGIEEIPVNVIAKETVEILFLDYQKIIGGQSKHCQFHEQLISNMIQILAKKNLHLNERINVISKRSIRQKIIAYLTSIQRGEESSIELLLSRQELADFLCVDRSAMTTELYKMKEEGIIDFSKNKFSFK